MLFRQAMIRPGQAAQQWFAADGLPSVRFVSAAGVAAQLLYSRRLLWHHGMPWLACWGRS